MGLMSFGYKSRDQRVQVSFQLSAQGNKLRPPFVVAAQNDKALLADISKMYESSLDLELDMFFNPAPYTPIPFEQAARGERLCHFNIDVPQRYLGVLSPDLIKKVAKNPVFLRQIELLLLDRQNKLG